MMNIPDLNSITGSRRPSVFIGSSSEALPVASLVVEILSDHFEVTLWNNQLFQEGETTIEGLVRIVQSFDFALLVLSDDETLVTSKKSSNAIPRWYDRLAGWIGKGVNCFASPRDNVVFELGMFYGAKGRRKSFALVVPSKRGRPKIPSDLFGVTLTFATRPNGGELTKDSLSGDLVNIINAIAERFENEAEFELLPSTGSAVGYFLNFVVPACAAIQRMEAFEIEGRAYDLRSGNFEFKIVLPSSLNDANQTSAEHYCRKHGLISTQVQGYRSFPFWVQPSIEEGKVVFWDYPTALKSSDEAVKFATRTAYLSSAPIRKAMERRELFNFEKVIHLLLTTTSEGAPFRQNIKMIHHDQ